MARTTKNSIGGWTALATVLLACGGSSPSPGSSKSAGARGNTNQTTDATYAALKARADDAQKLSREAVAKAYPTAFTALDYDPKSAEYLDTIQASALALSDGEQTALGENGFVISSAREFPTFVRGYAEIYAEHLPVYVSADAVLESVHSAYDSILLLSEETMLIDELTTLLQSMRGRLAQSNAQASVRADVDDYLAVALSLLLGKNAEPVAGGDATAIAMLVDQATKATGTGSIELFGASRDEDFSQFEPRGHYVGEARLEQYFRAMIWLGRVDMRLVETQPDGGQVFHRAQYDAMLVLRDTIGSDLDSWHRIDDLLKLFVGASDNMVVPEVDQLIANLGGADAARKASDAAVEKALIAGGYGEQQIASYLMVNDGTVATLPLNRSFLLFGQRYIVDSNVFSAVVYDRVPDRNRLMPNPLEAAFGALGNDQAFALDPDVATFDALPGPLARVRVLVDAQDSAFWESSMYNLWLSSLRALSPPPDAASFHVGLPKLAKSEAWGRRVLNAQLGSWAELRHDTLLYAKQSYSGIPICDFPDAYVDPYPELFAALGKYAALGLRISDAIAAANPDAAMPVSAYFHALGNAAATLEQIAHAELAGDALSAAELAFVNDAVRIVKQNEVCTTVDVPDGWLAKLYLDPAQSIEFDPTIADVHTQPADAGGNLVGNVLHVGTGYPRFMVATIDSCGGGPRAYAGVVFAYHEQITTNFQRLTDQDWAANFQTGGTRPSDVPWLSNVLAR